MYGVEFKILEISAIEVDTFEDVECGEQVLVCGEVNRHSLLVSNKDGLSLI